MKNKFKKLAIIIFGALFLITGADFIDGGFYAKVHIEQFNDQTSIKKFKYGEYFYTNDLFIGTTKEQLNVFYDKDISKVTIKNVIYDNSENDMFDKLFPNNNNYNDNHDTLVEAYDIGKTTFKQKAFSVRIGFQKINIDKKILNKYFICNTNPIFINYQNKKYLLFPVMHIYNGVDDIKNSTFSDNECKVLLVDLKTHRATIKELSKDNTSEIIGHAKSPYQQLLEKNLKDSKSMYVSQNNNILQFHFDDDFYGLGRDCRSLFKFEGEFGVRKNGIIYNKNKYRSLAVNINTKNFYKFLNELDNYFKKEDALIKDIKNMDFTNIIVDKAYSKDGKQHIVNSYEEFKEYVK